MKYLFYPPKSVRFSNYFKKFSFTILKSIPLLIALQTCSIVSKPPNESGVLYIFQTGDSLFSVSKKFGLSIMDIKRANEIYDENDVVTGIPLYIPGNYLPPSHVVDSSYKLESPSNQIKDRPAAQTGYKQTQYLNNFIWPSNGSISSNFGPRNGRIHQGIDIRANKGKTILAAEDGVITFSGRKRGFGRVVIIKHKHNFKTLYAHNKANKIKKGDFVKKGQQIAVMGSTGRSTGVHLHFEVHRDNKVVNPISLLPSKKNF